MEQKPKSGASPVGIFINLIVAALFGAGGWFFSPQIVNLLPAAAIASLSFETTRIIITVILFFLGLALSALILSLFTPKDPRGAREGDMERERERMRAQQKAERERARKSGRSGRR
jgi:hypothetical protein